MHQSMNAVVGVGKMRLLQRLQHWYAQRGWHRKLWLQALTIQLFSVLLIRGVTPAVINSTLAFEFSQLGLPVQSPVFWLAVHLVIVSVLARAISMPVWWRWIHIIFPLAVLCMQQVHIPAGVYLSGFILTLVLYWSVHNTRVPFYPSFPATWRAMLHLCDQHAGAHTLRVLDIGSGLGDVAMFLAKERLQDHVAGIEIAPLPWLLSWLRSTLGGSAASFSLGDYRQLDFAELDVIFAYLSPAVMTDVWCKVQQEMRPGSLFVSSEFPVEGVTPSRTIFPTQHSPALYVYSL